MKTLVFYIVCLVVISLSAQCTIELPLNNTSIPITGQSLSILTIAYLCRPAHAIMIATWYVFLGVVGLPILADGASGFSKLIGPSGGFLYGFIIVSGVISYLSNTLKNQSFQYALLIMLGTTAALLVIGVGHLSLSLGWPKAIEYGFLPFWKGAIIKSLLGAVLVVIFRKSLLYRYLKEDQTISLVS